MNKTKVVMSGVSNAHSCAMTPMYAIQYWCAQYCYNRSTRNRTHMDTHTRGGKGKTAAGDDSDVEIADDDSDVEVVEGEGCVEVVNL